MKENMIKHHAGKAVVLFLCGGSAYAMIEILWRGHTHWTMFVLGGALFLIIGGINEILTWETPLLLQGVAGAAVVTIAEFAAGWILNIKMGLGIWDYSDMPFNIMGQVCLPYTLLWIIVSILAIIVDDCLRWKLFGEEKPRYKFI